MVRRRTMRNLKIVFLTFKQKPKKIFAVEVGEKFAGSERNRVVSSVPGACQSRHAAAKVARDHQARERSHMPQLLVAAGCSEQGSRRLSLGCRWQEVLRLLERIFQRKSRPLPSENYQSLGRPGLGSPSHFSCIPQQSPLRVRRIRHKTLRICKSRDRREFLKLKFNYHRNLFCR